MPDADPDAPLDPAIAGALERDLPAARSRFDRGGVWRAPRGGVIIMISVVVSTLVGVVLPSLVLWRTGSGLLAFLTLVGVVAVCISGTNALVQRSARGRQTVAREEWDAAAHEGWRPVRPSQEDPLVRLATGRAMPADEMHHAYAGTVEGRAAGMRSWRGAADFSAFTSHAGEVESVGVATTTTVRLAVVVDTKSGRGLGGHAAGDRVVGGLRYSGDATPEIAEVLAPALAGLEATALRVSVGEGWVVVAAQDGLGYVTALERLDLAVRVAALLELAEPARR